MSIDEIIAGMSERTKDAVLNWPPEIGSLIGTILEVYRPDLVRGGFGYCGLFYELTDTGTAVRARLEETND